MTPPPIKVELLPYEPNWAAMVEEEGKVIKAALGSTLLAVHHIGSTAIPGISAKPILNLIPVVTGLPKQDSHRGEIEAIGYEWWGELGLSGRRYCTKMEADEASYQSHDTTSPTRRMDEKFESAEKLLTPQNYFPRVLQLVVLRTLVVPAG